jgi:hypothetical protein
MRRSLIAFALLLTVVPSIEAAPFLPTTYTIESLGAVFTSSGTHTLCAGCEDLDPFNDVVAMITGFRTITLPFLPVSFGWGGLLTVNTLAPALPFSTEPIEIPIRVTMFDPNPEYPLPGVSEGILRGRLLIGIEGGSFFVLECCSGFVNGVTVFQAFFPPTPFPFPGGQRPINLEVHLSRPTEYTPVPEPGTLTLLTIGAAAFTRLRRR